MAIIDDKVVAMSFESDKFEKGVHSTIGALDKLKASLSFQNAGKGLDEISKSAGKVDLSHISRGVDEVSGKLNALRLTGIAVFSQLVTRAISAGTQFAKSFTIGPLQQGFAEYSTNLNSIQTILANTQASGAGLKEVNAALQELNRYSDKTIYNFSQMARNIGTFTAAGVDLDTATGSIKGIANLAALSGSNAEQASTAMYQLSQAIAAGKVNLQDWNSVVNAGMGGTVFQRALAQTGVAMGTLKESSLKLVGPMKNVEIAGSSFRNSLSKVNKKGQSWLTSDVLTKTLETFTGDLTDAQLKAEGFNDAQIKAIQQTAKTATHAATEVKTLSQVFDVAKETAGSGWAQTFQLIFGDFGEAKTTFTGLSNAINGFINVNSDARNKVLGDWKKLGGRVVLIQSIKQTFEALGDIIKPIKDAFRDIFPAVTGKNLFNITMRFEELSRALKPSPKTIANLRLTFQGLFAVLDIGKQIVGGIFTVFGKMFGALHTGNGGFLEFTGNIGQMLVKLDEALKEGDRLHNFFVKMGDILVTPIKLFQTLASAIGNLFNGFSSGGISSEIGGMTIVLTAFESIMSRVADVWDRFSNSFSNIDGIVDTRSVVEGFVSVIQGLGDAIANAATNINFDAILQVIRTGLFAGIFVLIKNFLGKGSLLNQVGKLNVFQNLSKGLSGLSGSMVAMQNNIRAKTLKEIAIAIALLAGSLFVLSLIKPERLNAAIGAITVMFGELIGAMVLIEKLSKTKGMIKLPIIAASMIAFAIAIDLLVVAVLALSRLSWEELAKGLVSVGVLLGVISGASIVLSANAGGMIRASIAITGIAVAMKILASALKDFGQMSWDEIKKGLGSVTGALIAITAAMRLMPTSGMVAAGVGMIAIATALKILADAIGDLGRMDTKTLGKGLGSIAIALGSIVLAVRLMPKNMIQIGAGLLLVATSMKVLAGAIERMGNMTMEQIAHGLGALAGSLIILGTALKFMGSNVRGAAALSVTAAGIAVLAPALVMLGKQKWENIVKGLVSLGGALLVMGIAGAAIGGAAVPMLAFGAALFLIGAGLALVGASIFLVAAGISALAIAGPTGVGIAIAAFKDLLNAIPDMAKDFILGILEIVRAFAATAPKFVDAMIKILNSLLDLIIRAAPKLGEAFTVLLGVAIKALDDNKDKLIKAGFDLLVSLLKGVRDNIKEVVKIVTDIVVTFLKSLTNNIGRLITAGAGVLVALLKGISNNIGKVVAAAGDIMIQFVKGIASNVLKVVAAGLSIVSRLIVGIGQGTVALVKAAANVITQFITEIGKAGVRLVAAGVNAVIKFIEGLGKNGVKLANAAGQTILDFLNGLTAAVNKYAPEIRTASAKLGIAIIDGMTFGMVGKAEAMYKKAKGIAKKALGILGGPFGWGSPATEMIQMGSDIMLGLTMGLHGNSKQVYAAALAISNGTIGTFTDAFQIQSPSKVMMQIGQYVGQGFAEGLRGSSDDIKSVVTELNNKLLEAMAAANETIASEQDKLDKLLLKPKKNAAAIKQAQEVISENENLLRRSTAGHIELTKALSDEQAKLTNLAKQYEIISDKLNDARDALKNATSERDNAQKSFADQYSTSPEISGRDVEEIKNARLEIMSEQDKLAKLLASKDPEAEAVASAKASVAAAEAQFDSLVAGRVLNAQGTAIDQLATYEQALKHQTDAVSAYQATLNQLRKLGLDDATYQKLLTDGTADQQFASQLLAGGRTAVQGLNKLDKQLMAVSATLATNAAKNLYQAGVDAAQGLVNGLASKKSSIRHIMEDIAEEMVAAMRKKLQVKSPSRIFAEIGEYAMLGLAKGFGDTSHIVTNAVDEAAKNALAAMRKRMGDISSIVTDELNPSPVITPVLDLTQVRAHALEMAKITGAPLNASASFNQASQISSEKTTAEVDAEVAASAAPTIIFEQNNHSPESLSDVQIYRQTKNQLSQLKTVLAIS